MREDGDTEKLQRLGEEVRKQRFKAQLSQEELAKRIGLHRTYISDIERGMRNPTVLVLVKLADGLEIEAGILVSAVEG